MSSSNEPNPWIEIKNSGTLFVLQWIRCSDCKKWRICRVRTSIIDTWKEPKKWKCSYDPGLISGCATPQEVLSKGGYEQIQIDALTLQRNLVIANNKQRKRKRSNRSWEQSPTRSPMKRRKRNATYSPTIPRLSLGQLKISQKTNSSCVECILCDKNKKENAMLKKKNDEMKKRLDILEVRRKHVNALDFNQLVELKHTMREKIKLIEEAEKRFVDNACKCIACIERKKCISFDGCEHIALCDECESKMKIKQCPICRSAYSNIKKVNFS